MPHRPLLALMTDYLILLRVLTLAYEIKVQIFLTIAERQVDEVKLFQSSNLLD